MQRNLLVFSSLYILLSSCEKSEPVPSLPYDTGVIVINSGNFSDNNGSLSLIQRNSSTVSFDIFQKENLRSIAGGISGYEEVAGKGIILVDNSTPGKDLIEIVNARTFKSVATIPSLEIENPRNVTKVSDSKAYITAWDATGDFSNFYKNLGYVAVLDLNTNKISKKIAVQNGAETILMIGNEVFVGCTGSGKTVLTVIDALTDTKKLDIEIGRNPNLIGLDANNKLWVFAAGELVKINPSNKIVETRIKITSLIKSKSPSSFVLSADKKTIYFTNSFYDAADNFKQKGETYSFSINAATIAADKPFINRLFGGGLAIDSQSGYLYAGLIPSLKQAGFVFRYTSNGVLIDSVKAEIGPSKFYFKL